MRKFPSPLRKDGHRFVLDEEQRAWLRTVFPVTETRIVAEAMGASYGLVMRFAREEGLHKSAKGLERIRRRQHARAARTNERNGCYDRKRGKPVSEATTEGLRRWWDGVRDGRNEMPMTRIRRTEPERYEEIIRKNAKSHAELVRKERLRMMYGLERKTRLKLIVMHPYTRKQIQHRHCALRRGYLLDEDCSEGTPGRYVIYYDDETRRDEHFEAICKRDGLTVMRDE